MATNVTIKNKIAQKIDIAVRDASNVLQSVPLLKGAQVTVEESKVGQYTRNLARKGHVKIRPA